MISTSNLLIGVICTLMTINCMNSFVIPSPSSSSLFRQYETSLFMGKQMTMPGPAGKGSSGPSTSDYRAKKMRDRLTKKNKKNKKKGGGFGSDDDGDDDDTSAKKKTALMDVEMKEEPEGGTDVKPLVPFVLEDGDFVIRLKDMGVVEESDPAYTLSEKLGTDVHNFWLTAVADGSKIQKARTTIMKDAAKNANFPGFRKGQVPPYAQPKMTMFALREEIITSCQEAIAKFGVNEVNEDELGAVTFNEDVDAISKAYNIKTCPSVPFTANFRAVYDKDAVRSEDEKEETAAAAGDVVDVESEPVEEE